jgi:hypothetical protein
MAAALASLTPAQPSEHEQFAFLNYTGDGQQDVAHLRGSTRLQLNAMAVAMSDLAATL